MFPAEVAASGPDVMVTIFEDAMAAESLKMARELRDGGFRVEVYPASLRGGKDLGKAFKYADSRGARYVAVMGQDEASRGEIKIKNLATGEQAVSSRSAVALWIREHMKTRPASDLQPPSSAS